MSKKPFYAQFPASPLGKVLVEVDAESAASAETAVAEFYSAYGFVIRSSKTARKLVGLYEFRISSRKIVAGSRPRLERRKIE